MTNLKLVIQASDPQGNGITRAYSKAAAFDDPSTPVATAVDIKAKYDAKCGTPSAGSPKVFFKYFFVNTATWALPLYESFLGIKPSDGDSDEFRRQRILFKLQHVDVSTKDFMNSIINLYSVGHIEEVNEEYYFKVYCIMNGKDTTTLQKLITQLNIYKPAHLGYAIYLGYSWNGKIHWNGEATFSTATIVSKKGVMTNG